jgi:hypothetical protein
LEHYRNLTDENVETLEKVIIIICIMGAYLRVYFPQLFVVDGFAIAGSRYPILKC